MGEAGQTRFLSLFGYAFGSSRDLEDAFAAADRFPSDCQLQERLYRMLLDNNELQELIQRFESRKYGCNDECLELYRRALELSGTSERQRRASSAEQRDSAGGGASRAAFYRSGNKGGGSRKNELGVLGSKERPIYIQNMGREPVYRRVMSIFWNVLLLGGAGYILFMSNNQKVAGMSLKVHQFFKKDAENHHTFEDVQGCDEAKAELQEVVAFLKNPDKFSQLGARLPKGVLLVGPPGTGKTLLAKAVAGEAGVPFVYASGSEFDELFVGMGSLRIRQMFESAKEQAPSIIFIDEIDAIGSKRNPRDPQHARMSLNQLLVEMDGFNETRGVIVIAATNFPESLDKALLRPGRFDRHVHVPLPDVRGRTQILQLYLKNTPAAADVDVGVLARSTPGFSGADLSKLVNTAKIMASVQSDIRLTMQHLERAKDEMIMGTERRSAVISEEDRRLTAYHEGGHAIVALYTPYAMAIHKATIMPRGSALGMVAQIPDGDQLSLSKIELLAKLDVCMGGRVAEELIFGSEHVTTGASSDFSQATTIARAMVTKYGMSDKIGPIMLPDEEYELLSSQTRSTVDQEVRLILEESQKRAKCLLQKHSSKLHALARALLDRETMTRPEIETVLRGDSLPPILSPA